MKKQGSGWKGESRRHSLARKGVKTVLPDGRRFDVSKFVANGYLDKTWNPSPIYATSKKDAYEWFLEDFPDDLPPVIITNIKRIEFDRTEDGEKIYLFHVYWIVNDEIINDYAKYVETELYNMESVSNIMDFERWLEKSTDMTKAKLGKGVRL